MEYPRELSLFEKVILEAEGDPPDINMSSDSGPPDLSPNDNIENTPNENPPDINEDNIGMDNTPPEIGDDNEFDVGSNEDIGEDNGDGGFGDDQSDDNNTDNLKFGEKISAIMNLNLYQKFLSLLTTISNQITMIKDNSDTIFSISPETVDIVDKIKRLDENIRAYIENYFENENYSSNLLFFNKSINLLKMLNDVLNKNLQKGIKATK